MEPERMEDEEEAAAPVVRSVLADHQSLVQRTMGDDKTKITVASLIQVPADPVDDAHEKSKYSFAEGKEPRLIMNWCGAGGSSVLGPDGIYTPVRPKRPGYQDMESQRDASGWVPMVAIESQGEVVMVPNEPPADGIFLGSRSGTSAYRVLRSIGSGGYGSVFLACRVEPRTMEDIPNGEVAMKFVRMDQRMFSVRQGSPERALSPLAANGVFAQYLAQRTYGGCMPHTVCMHDAFMLAIPDPPPSHSVAWYAVIVMERMDGNVMNLVRSPDILGLPPAQRYRLVMLIVCKMARALFDLEMQRIFHDDIKPANFLYRKVGDATYDVKVTDFDLAALSLRSWEAIDGHKVVTEAVKQGTRGQLDRDSPSWASVPGIRYLLAPRISSGDVYKPPEYDIVRSIMEGLSGAPPRMSLDENVVAIRLPDFGMGNPAHPQAVRDFQSMNVYNADWLSRMMAYELASTIRELFMAAGLGAVYTDNRMYPVDVMNQQAGSVQRLPSTLVRMMPEGLDNIVPDKPAYTSIKRLQIWAGLRLKTIDESKVGGYGVTAVNNVLATIIAPKMPDKKNPLTHYPLSVIANQISGVPYLTLCADQNNFTQLRPTTGELLQALLSAAMADGLTPAPNFQVESVPSTLQSMLDTNITMVLFQ